MDQTRRTKPKGHILLVEDEERVRAVTRMLLKMQGYQVTEAGDGEEALALFRKGKFDIVVTDFCMPRLRGNELAVRIKKQAPTQMVLMVTAHPAELLGSENPVDRVLNKPYSVTELQTAIRTLNRRRRQLAKSGATEEDCGI
jgi:DNA-binding response OmpR family regulator